jgi:hypothetical protein
MNISLLVQADSTILSFCLQKSYVHPEPPLRSTRHSQYATLVVKNDPEVLERLIVKMGTAQTLEEAQKHLFDVDSNEKKN